MKNVLGHVALIEIKPFDISTQALHKLALGQGKVPLNIKQESVGRREETETHSENPTITSILLLGYVLVRRELIS